MVHLTVASFGRSGVSLLRIGRNKVHNAGPDKFWRVQQYLRFSYHFHGRIATCYRLGMRYVYKALSKSGSSRKAKRQEIRNLWNARIDAASQEHNCSGENLMEGLSQCNIQLDRKVLQDLAIYEPRTFQSLVEIAKQRLEENAVSSIEPLSTQQLRRGLSLKKHKHFI